MRITVARKTKNNPAPSVTDRLLSTQESMTERGKAELYSQGADVNIHSLGMPLQALILPGTLVEVNDSDQGEVWRAKNKAVSINITAKGISQSITVERPLL